MSKKVTIFGKQMSAVLIALLAMTGLASAGLLSYYGLAVGTATVEQSVKLDGNECTGGDYEACTITYTVGVSPAVAGSTYTNGPFELTNDAEVPVTVDFETDQQPQDEETPGEVKGITTTYLGPLDYSWSGTVGYQGIVVSVEDDGNQIIWTVDFPLEAPYDEVTEGNGLMAVGLVIATDGEGNGPVFQIHNNDGTDPGFEYGTWLMSPWGPEITDGWFGWHSGDTNTPVTELDWVSATGGRYNEVNPDGTFTIRIDKSELGKDFHWALNLAIGSGFIGDYLTYEQMSVPDGVTAWFDWTTPIVDMTVPNYEYAGLVEELVTPLTLEPGEVVSFYIVNEFDIALIPDTYKITTEIAVPE